MEKIYIAIALIENSKIILLDEQSSGIISKRALWNFLKIIKTIKYSY